MTPDKNDSELDQMTKEELKNLVRSLQFELRGEDHLTKVDIINQLLNFEELGLTEDDLMNVEQEYNIGLKKSGLLKIYHFIRETIQQEK